MSDPDEPGPDTLEDIRLALDLLAARADHVTNWGKELGRVQVRIEAMQRRDGLISCRPYDARLDAAEALPGDGRRKPLRWRVGGLIGSHAYRGGASALR